MGCGEGPGAVHPHVVAGPRLFPSTSLEQAPPKSSTATSPSCIFAGTARGEPTARATWEPAHVEAPFVTHPDSVRSGSRGAPPMTHRGQSGIGPPRCSRPRPLRSDGDLPFRRLRPPDAPRGPGAPRTFSWGVGMGSAPGFFNRDRPGAGWNTSRVAGTFHRGDLQRPLRTRTGCIWTMERGQPPSGPRSRSGAAAIPPSRPRVPLPRSESAPRSPRQSPLRMDPRPRWTARFAGNSIPRSHSRSGSKTNLPAE